ncbi:MAG: hypothetical protein M3O36_15395 [Myxococcota bacterium]|nr:hypothetical protein [Myxococcota bacterium]
MRATRIFLACLVALLATGACGSRPSYWETTVPRGVTSFGLGNGVALVDNADHRVVMLTALADQQLSKRAFPIGRDVVSVAASPDGLRLFVLSAGDSPRRTKADEYPSLTVIDTSTLEPASTRYSMTIPLPNLAIDPLGQWAVAYTGPSAPASFVENANEIVVFDLATPGSVPLSRTIRSHGGTPQRLTFTPLLQLPKAQKRLLIIETDIDVTLLELGDASSDVTIPLTSGTNARQVTPAGVVVDGFDPTSAADARIALRAKDDRNVFTFTLGPSDTNDFQPIVNVIDVGGVPSDLAFVRADNNALRVVALVPSSSTAVLVDPDTSITTRVALPAPYSHLSLVTNVLGSGTGTDVAMLWASGDGAVAGVALWTLGNTVGQPYHSVEVLPVSQPIQAVDDVRKQQRLKVLETADTSSVTGFFVLDLLDRTASPLQTAGKASLAIAPDGLRLWAFSPGGTNLAKLEFSNLNPVPLTTDTAIDAVYDVARPATAAGGDGGRSLIALHKQGTIGATVFDALNPDTATSRRVPALLLEGP